MSNISCLLTWNSRKQLEIEKLIFQSVPLRVLPTPCLVQNPFFSLGSCPGRCSPQCYPSCCPVCCYTAQRSALFQHELLQRRPQQQQQLQQQFYFRPQVQSAPSPAQYLQTFPAAGSAPSFALARAPSPAPSPAPPPPSPPPPPCPADCPKECYPRCSNECCVPQPPPMPLYLKRKQSVAVACEGHKLKIKCPNK